MAPPRGGAAGGRVVRLAPPRVVIAGKHTCRPAGPRAPPAHACAPATPTISSIAASPICMPVSASTMACCSPPLGSTSAPL